MKILYFMILVIPLKMFAFNLPIPNENIQLQRLINKSEEQIQSLREILRYQKTDTKILEKASKIIEHLSSGIDKSIENYEDDEIYEKALIELQKKNYFSKTNTDSKNIEHIGFEKDKDIILQNFYQDDFDDLIKFQQESVKANQTDINLKTKLYNDLKIAGPGFLPKIMAQAQLENWQTNIRLSTQFTELLSVVRSVREELRLLRHSDNKANAIEVLVDGSDIQNQKLKHK